MPRPPATSLPATPRRHRQVWLLVAWLLAVAPWTTLARAAPDKPSYDDTANCIAVMQTNADNLARQVKRGNKAQEPALRAEILRATALVGRTYLDGMHDSAEAKARLKAARERQAEWDAAHRASVRQTCVKRADVELANATSAERFIVERIAQVQFKRMLRAAQ